MAEIRGFCGVRYNTAKVHHPAEVTSPPYDVISPDQKMDYLRRSPFNVVRLILPDGEHPYQNAAGLFQSWLEQQVLIQDPEPSLYGYHQTYTTPEGNVRTRKGFMARIRLEDFDRGIVLPHEATLFAPKEDRLNLLRACQTNFSPIFGLYSDPDGSIDALLNRFTSEQPQTKVEDDTGIVNALWRISDRQTIQSVQEILKAKWVLIADGHHRYESCLVYRNEKMRENSDPEAPFHFTLMYFCNLDQPGITVLPYNRAVLNLPGFNYKEVLKRASQYFDVHEFEEVELARSALKREGESHTAFVALFAGSKSEYLFRLKPETRLQEFYPEGTPAPVRNLDVTILHRIFVERILGISREDVEDQKYLKYYKDQNEEIKDFHSGRIQIAFFLNPTRVSQVVDVSRAGDKMPQKSTFFYPKLMTGLVINKH